MMKLHDYQNTAADFTIDAMDMHGGAALWLGMGVGKTAISIDVLERRRRWGPRRKVLITGPKRVCERTWPKELKKWGSSYSHEVFMDTERRATEILLGPAEICIVNRENIQWLCNELRDRWPFGTVVIDESSSFKDPSSNRFKHLKRYTEGVDVLELTGTPGDYEALWSQVYLMDGGERLGKSITHYRHKFFVKHESGYGYRLRKGAAEEINARLQDICLSMTIDEGLPPVVENTIEVALPTGARRQYKELEVEYLLELEAGTVSAANAGVLSGKLRQLCNGALYIDPSVRSDDDDNAEKTANIHDAKLDALESILEEHGGDPVLVGYQFRSDWKRIKKRFPFAMHPDDPDALDKFEKGECRLLASHWQSIGHGVDGLQDEAWVTAWFGVPWSVEGFMQFNKRLDRQGQTRPGYRHFIVAEKSIEGRMLKTQRTGGASMRDMMDSVHADLKRRNAKALESAW